MIDVSDALAAILDSRSFVMSCRISVTLGGTILADDIPVIAGTEEFDDSLRVPERVQLSVPRIVDGVDMIPTGPTSPLAPYGQRMHVKIGVGIDGGDTEWMDRGEFLIHTTQLQGEEIAVTAVGLLEMIDEARLVAAFRPAGTFTTALRALVEPALTVIIDPAVTALDRSVPSDLNEDEDRLQAVLNLLTAWPARGQLDQSGVLRILAADDYPAGGVVQLYNFDDHETANVIQVGGAITRDGLYNTVVARGQAADGNTVIGVAYDKTAGGATSLTSYFNPLPVPFYYFSPLMTTSVQCQAAASSILTRKAALSAQRLQMDCVPDPRLCGNDLIAYRPQRSADPSDELATIIDRLVMPLTADSGPMRLVLREQVST